MFYKIWIWRVTTGRFSAVKLYRSRKYSRKVKEPHICTQVHVLSGGDGSCAGDNVISSICDWQVRMSHEEDADEGLGVWMRRRQLRRRICFFIESSLVTVFSSHQPFLSRFHHVWRFSAKTHWWCEHVKCRSSFGNVKERRSIDWSTSCFQERFNTVVCFQSWWGISLLHTKHSTNRLFIIFS